MWSLLLATAGWIAGWLTFGAPQRLRARSIDLRDPSPSPTTSDAPEPVLSVVIPARNEEHSLPLLLADLAEHAPPGTEVIVVDDDSVDRTAEVAAGVWQSCIYEMPFVLGEIGTLKKSDFPST